jgi:hypothetical protein
MFCIYYYGQEQRKKFGSKIEIDSTVSSFDDTLRPPQCDKKCAKFESEMFPTTTISADQAPAATSAQNNSSKGAKEPRIKTTIWGFPKIGVPPNHPFIWLCILNQPFGGKPIFGNLHLK